MSRTISGRIRRALVTVLAAAGVAGGLTLVGSAPAQAGPPLPDGPYTCSAGFVWREAFTGDKACVTGAVRGAVAYDNSQAVARRLPGSVFCVNGFVWREARPGDVVCVTPATRSQAYSDNSDQILRLADPAATPRGGATVSTTLHQLGGYLYVQGSGFTPNARISFSAARIGTVLPQSLGPRYADGAGKLSYGYLADVRCRPNQQEWAVIVVQDHQTGVVTTAGTTGAYSHCG